VSDCRHKEQQVTTDSFAELRGWMGAFVDGCDRSSGIAGQIEVALDELFGEREPYADLVLALASYRPGGGELLYDAEAVIPLMRLVLEHLRTEEFPT
jgi:hypothetical protein